MKNMKYKLFAIIAVLALTGSIIFMCCGGDDGRKEKDDTTSVDDYDDERVELATTIEMTAEPKSHSLADEKFARDVDKVLKTVSGLSTAGKTVLGGKRGKSSLGVSYCMKAPRSGGISDGMLSLLSSRTEPSARKTKTRVSTSYESGDDDDDEPASRKGKRGGKYNGRRSGLLTAGEWNDLSHWGYWAELLDDESYSGKPGYWEFYPENLVVVKVVDDDNVGIANVSVELFNSNSLEFAAKTDNAGYAYCWINLFGESNRKISAKDYSLKVDGDWVKKPIKLTTKQDKKLNVNVVVDDGIRHPKARADVAFIVDATGSMSDEIKFLKSDLSYIIDHASSESKVALRTAALFYRDEGDAYLTRANDFTKDASETQEFVSRQDADGGGDYAEAVHSALEAGLEDLSWNASARARIAFLILDAPAHHNSNVIESLQKSIRRYAKHGIKLIPVAASGIDKDTEFMLRFFDLATGGTYVFLTDDSGIGNSHIKASVGDHKVESLTELMVRLIKKYVK